MTTVPTETRRRFFRSLLGRGLSVAEELRGKPQLSLAQLGELPEQTLLQMVPCWAQPERWSVRDASLWHRAARGQWQHVCELEPETLAIVESIDGERSLTAIAQHAARALQLTGGDAQQLTLDVFLQFARRAICVPRDPPDPSEPPAVGQEAT